MKNLIGLTLALALVLSVAPVMAGESFPGMESLSSAVAALPDADLAKVEGGQLLGVGDINIAVDINVAVTNQIVALVQTLVALAGEGTNAQAGRVGLEGVTTQE